MPSFLKLFSSLCYISFIFRSVKAFMTINVNASNPRAIHVCETDEPCTVLCSEYQSCWNDTIQCADAPFCTIQCNKQGSCGHTIIDCEQSVRCALSCDGPYSCSEAQIIWPSNPYSSYSLHCGTSKACDGFTFDAPSDQAFTFDCSSWSCEGLTINCPQNAACNIQTGADPKGAKHGLIVNGGVSSDAFINVTCIGEEACSSAEFNGNNLLINECRGHNACANAKFNGKALSDEHIPYHFACNGLSACANTQLPRPPDKIDYSLYCDGAAACAGAIVTCPANAMCQIFCVGSSNGTAACSNLQVIDRGSTLLQIDCQINGEISLCDDDNISIDIQIPLPTPIPTTHQPTSQQVTPFPTNPPIMPSIAPFTTSSTPYPSRTTMPSLAPTTEPSREMTEKPTSDSQSRNSNTSMPTLDDTNDQDVDTADSTEKHSNSDSLIMTIFACLFGITLLILIVVIVYKMRYKKSSKIVIGSVGSGIRKKNELELVQSVSPSLAPSNNIDSFETGMKSATLASSNNVNQEQTNIDPRNYEKWNVQQFISWISELESGRYRRYTATLIEGMKADNMTPYDLIIEITEPKDFMSYRMNVDRADRGDLIKHFEKLKEGGFEEGFVDGDNNTNTTMMEGNVTNGRECKEDEHKLGNDEFIVEPDIEVHFYPTPTDTPQDNALFIADANKSGNIIYDDGNNLVKNDAMQQQQGEE